MIVTHKQSNEHYKAALERVTITTPQTSYDEWYVRLTQLHGIKSDMCPYTEAVKRYTFPKYKG